MNSMDLKIEDGIWLGTSCQCWGSSPAPWRDTKPSEVSPSDTDYNKYHPKSRKCPSWGAASTAACLENSRTRNITCSQGEKHTAVDTLCRIRALDQVLGASGLVGSDVTNLSWTLKCPNSCWVSVPLSWQWVMSLSIPIPQVCLWSWATVSFPSQVTLRAAHHRQQPPAHFMLIALQNWVMQFGHKNIFNSVINSGNISWSNYSQHPQSFLIIPRSPTQTHFRVD